MSSQCLKGGSPKPQVQGDNLILYSSQICPYAQRVRLVLLAKEIPHDLYNIVLNDKPEWFKLLTPSGNGLVPLLEFPDKRLLNESLVISEFLDEEYAGSRKLLPQDPYQKAIDKIVVQNLSDITTSHSNLLRRSTEENFDDVLEKIHKGLNFFENELKSRKSRYFEGTKPGFLDYMIWPFFERLECYSMMLTLKNLKVEVPSQIREWITSMFEDQAVKECLLSPKQHFDFLQSRLSGNPDFSIGLK